MFDQHVFNRVIDEGRVACPSRNEDGDVDVDVCARCGWLEAVEQAKGVQYVRCGFKGVRGLDEYSVE